MWDVVKHIDNSYGNIIFGYLLSKAGHKFFWQNYQKQPLADVLQNGCTEKNFAIFTGKNLCWSHFLITLQTIKPVTLLKKRLQHRYIPVNIARISGTAFLYNTCSCCFWINLGKLPLKAGWGKHLSCFYSAKRQSKHSIIFFKNVSF